MNLKLIMIILFTLLLIFGWILTIHALIGYPKAKRGIFSEDQRPSSPQRYIVAMLYLLLNIIMSPVYVESLKIIKQLFD